MKNLCSDISGTFVGINNSYTVRWDIQYCCESINKVCGSITGPEVICGDVQAHCQLNSVDYIKVDDVGSFEDDFEFVCGPVPCV